ncbi:MAG TPA: MTH938/NDUFAF3 family protein [Mariprofundaceae bacterium]|nr:MTH938/NDUFAF3 family protein [Mariprofundaceae bacterium]
MHISHYSFGSITVDGAVYRSDVILSPNGINDRWWRREGRRLGIDDLGPVLEYHPEVLVIGTGNVGCMEVPQATLDHLASLGIKTHMARTGEAVGIYNRLARQYKAIVAALHLTC